MNSIKRFFLDIKSSIWDPNFYQGLLVRPTKSAFAYFAKFCVLISFVSAIWISVVAIPAVRSFSTLALDSITSAYPQNATFELKGGVLSSTPSIPYRIAPTNETIKAELAKMGYEYSVVIDTNRAVFSDDVFASYKSPVVITKNTIAMKKNSGKIELLPLRGMPDTVITKDVVQKYALVTKDFIQNTTPVIAPLSFFAFFVYGFGSTLLYMFFGALVVWLALKALSVPTTYWKSYVIGLHAITLPLILFTLAPFLGLPTVPFLTTVILVLIVYLNFTAKPAATAIV